MLDLAASRLTSETLLLLAPRTQPPRASAAAAARRGRPALARAAGDRLADQTTVYNGVYGPWSVDDADVREVLLYRAGLVTAAASFLVAASGAFLPEGNAVGDAVRQGADLFYAAGAGGLGLSLVLIHIYVTPIKRFLQALWAVGVLGSVGTYALAARPLDEGLVRYVLRAPRRHVVRRAHLRRAHWPRLQGRSLLWEIGSWYLDVCYPHPSSWTPVWFHG
ncbi:hypothetical protein ZWY2020_008478 [Hordeum vulgare]|nr:hypothetical protein ZWY2020_008478 [Hordeum vulgare]